MRNVLKNLLLFSGSAPITYASYVAGLLPLLWYKLNEPSGTTITNYGSLGAPQDGTASNLTLAQTGQLGAGQAAQWNATTSFVSTPNTASLDGIPNLTYCFLHKQLGGGEGGVGRLMGWGNSASADVLTVASGRIDTHVNNGTFSSTVISWIPTGTWVYTFITYDNSDKKLRVYKGVSGVVSEATYGTQTAGTGNPTATAATLYLGNRQNNDTTYDGLFDEFLIFNRILSAAEMLQMTLLAGLT